MGEITIEQAIRLEIVKLELAARAKTEGPLAFRKEVKDLVKYVTGEPEATAPKK